MGLWVAIGPMDLNAWTLALLGKALVWLCKLVCHAHSCGCLCICFYVRVCFVFVVTSCLALPLRFLCAGLFRVRRVVPPLFCFVWDLCHGTIPDTSYTQTPLSGPRWEYRGVSLGPDHGGLPGPGSSQCGSGMVSVRTWALTWRVCQDLGPNTGAR
jgi:hypothetical protein